MGFAFGKMIGIYTKGQGQFTDHPFIITLGKKILRPL